MAYTNNLHVVYGEASLGVNGQDFAYLFSYERGGLESLKLRTKNGFTARLHQLFGGRPPITIAVAALIKSSPMARS